MQVAAGLGERPEQAVFTPTEEKLSGTAKKRPGFVGETEKDQFHRLYQGLVAAEKDKAKEERLVHGELWAQLLLLHPELVALPMDQEMVAEAEAELLTAVPDSAEEPSPLSTGLMAETILSAAANSVEAREANAEPIGEHVTDKMPVEFTEHQETQLTMLDGIDAQDKQGIKDTAAAAASKAETAAITSTDRTPLPDKHLAVARPETRPTGEAVASLPQPEVRVAKGSGIPVASPNDSVEDGAVAPQQVSAEAAGEEGDFAGAFVEAEPTPDTVVKVGKLDTEGPQPTKKPADPSFNPVASELPTVLKDHPVTAGPAEPPTPEISQEELTAQIMNGTRLMVKNGVTKVQIQLEPAELGKLELSLLIEKDLVAARFVTETQGVQSLIEANLPQLRSALEEAGLQVDLLQVGVQTGTDPQTQNQNEGQFRRNIGWRTTAEMFVAEEQIFADDAWHGMVNLRI